MEDNIEVVDGNYDNTLYVRLDEKRRLYFRAILGTRLPYIDDKNKYDKYLKNFKDGRCVWDECILLKLKEFELKTLYESLDKQIEQDYLRIKNGDGRLIDPMD